ncbi:MAG: hypothetical protein R6W89_02905 [Candidatus Hydrogenedentota bacterium]
MIASGKLVSFPPLTLRAEWRDSALALAETSSPMAPVAYEPLAAALLTHPRQSYRGYKGKRFSDLQKSLGRE